MLTNWADNIIIPSITSFKNSLTQLQEVANIFVNDPTSDNLLSLKEIWFSSYLKWQYVEMFDIGIAEEIYLKNRLNLYPANIEKIENNIFVAGCYNGSGIGVGTLFGEQIAIKASEQNTKEMETIEARNKPTWLPPQPFLNIGVKTRLIYERISCLLYTSPSPRDLSTSRMPSSA